MPNSFSKGKQCLIGSSYGGEGSSGQASGFQSKGSGCSGKPCPGQVPQGEWGLSEGKPLEFKKGAYVNPAPTFAIYYVEGRFLSVALPLMQPLKVWWEDLEMCGKKLSSLYSCFFFLREKKSPFFLREKKRVLWGKLVRENKPQRFSPNFGDTSWWGQPCSFTLRMLHLWNWAPGPVQGTRATGVNRVGGERALWSSHCAHNHGNQCMCTDCEGCCKWKSAKGCGDRLWQGLLWLGGQGILWRMTQVVRPRGCREQQPEGTAWVQLLASNTPTCRNHLCLFHYNKTWHLVALCGYVFSWRGCRLHHYSNF